METEDYFELVLINAVLIDEDDEGDLVCMVDDLDDEALAEAILDVILNVQFCAANPEPSFRLGLPEDMLLAVTLPEDFEDDEDEAPWREDYERMQVAIESLVRTGLLTKGTDEEGDSWLSVPQESVARACALAGCWWEAAGVQPPMGMSVMASEYFPGLLEEAAYDGIEDYAFDAKPTGLGKA